MSLVLGTGSAGGGGGGAPTDAQYVTLAVDATLTNERVLTGSANEIVITDGGAGGNVTLTAGTLIVQTDQANTWTTGAQTINTGAAGTIGLIVKGAAGQTANLQQWQDSAGAVLSGADERGILFTHGGTDVSNMFIGDNAGNVTASGTGNMCMGQNAGAGLTTGVANVCIGSEAGNDIAGGTQNMCIGSGAGQKISGGASNTCIGQIAGAALTGASYNVFIGGSAGSTATGSANTVIGVLAARKVTGDDNVVIGRSAGINLTSATANVLIGHDAGGALTTEDDRLYIANSNTSTPLVYGLFTGAGAGVTIHSQNTAGIPLIVKGIASQSSDLQQWQDSAGTELMGVESTGEIDFRWAMGNSTKDPTADAPADWVQVKIAGTSYYLPAYAA